MTFGQSWIDILPILRVQWVGFSHLPYKIYGYNTMFFCIFTKGNKSCYILYASFKEGTFPKGST